MKYKIFITEETERDIDEIISYVDRFDSPARGSYVLSKLTEAIERLKEDPSRGRHPGELIDVGVKTYREFFFKPYRIIYRITDRNVYITLVADGRRDMVSLFHNRLLR